MPPQKNPKVDYLRVYPGLNDFSDALEAIPDTAVGHLTHIKHVLARTENKQQELGLQIKSYFKQRNTDSLRSISSLLDTLLPAMDEKMRTATTAAEQVARQVDRLNADFEMIREHEIPKIVQFDPEDPAFYQLVPQDKAVNARTQARREAREARETRRVNQNAESRSGTPVTAPEPPVGRRRGRTPQTFVRSDAAPAAEVESEASEQHVVAEPAQPEYEPERPSRRPQSTSHNHDTEPKEEHTIPPVVMPVVTPENKADDVGGEVLVGMKRKRGSAPKSSEPVYCYCEKPSYGEMVGCDGSQCDREWFHLGCIGLSALPKGQWFCEECRAKLRRR